MIIYKSHHPISYRPEFNVDSCGLVQDISQSDSFMQIILAALQ